ncbi:MAG: CHAT domain-containing protein, partial [Ferruginibacter sp.]
IENKTHLVIIPHNELHFIPFEILENPETGKLLLNNFAVSYNYAASFLTKKEKFNDKQQVLAFAPFTGYTTDNELRQLTASKAEVETLRGKILTDTSATKSNFMKFAEQYGIIHLATHANANDSNPVQSFIAFYPQKDSSAMESRLYEPEIYNLNLSKSSLVILSACETGKGRLISGEGVMSLSRAFSYAGCPSVITSLWKAEDKATAFIMQQLHIYLQQGLNKDEALQKAKLDYLKSDKIEARFKTPDFWANLILVGDPSGIYKSKSQWIYWLVAVTAFVLAGLFFYRRYGRRWS